MSADADTIVGALAVDYWKLLRSFERLASEAPADKSARLQAQARFSAGRLSTHLEAYGLQLATFEGQVIAAGMPVVAINANEFEGQPGVIVESTIEPAVFAGARIVSVGRVVAAAGGV
jgi:hypothetical protein